MERISRREFLGTAAGAGGMLLAGGYAGRPLMAAEDAGWPKQPPVKIHVVYVGTGGAWPTPTFDAPAEVAKFKKYLAGVQARLGDVKFVGGELIPNTEQAVAKVGTGMAKADAAMLVHLSFGSSRPLLKLVDVGLPTAIFSQPFSGHDWMYIPQWQKAGKKVILLPSSDYSELERAAALLSVPVRLRQSRIVVVGRAKGTDPACSAEQIRQHLGPELVMMSREQIIAAHRAVDPRAAEAEAEQYWISQARTIVEPPKSAIVNSARLYLAIKDIMIRERAQAITSSHCMGAPAKGCLTFSKLNDLGLVGACEGDMDSTLTMLIFSYAFGIPGFITDPLFDTSKNAVIHAHCTSTTKLDGPDGQRAPFLIRTQCDSNAGVSLEVRMRMGQEITCAKLANLDTMLLSAGKIIELTDYFDRGCRTQITTEVSDARQMAQRWGSGVLGNDMMTLLHRVVFYGNHLESVKDMAPLLGLKVIEEG
ncbi:twin-arginine translocation signal domain-containing protein [Planctomycetota bacterium]